MVAVAVGATIVGGVTQYASGKAAAKASKQGADRAADVQQYMYDTTREDYAPYRAVGQGALSKLAGMYGIDYTDTSKVNWDDYVRGNPDALANWNSLGAKGQQEFGSLQQFGKYHYEKDGSRRDLSPYTVGGGSAQGTSQPYGGFETSPGYQFRLDEGIKAIQRSAAARGSLASGATMKSLNNYAQGQASGEYNNYVNSLMNLAGIGSGATSGTASAGAQAASGIANAYTNAGNAQAAGAINTGNAINGTVQNLAGAYLYGQGAGWFGGKG
ncbi:hypothetical protein [Novosphingobium sp. KN65.2]|uniref:hypothetical protein n=1 Tax=Novosphingobium sp. KN65.2 TaxID=1478134 RepID=UPI0005E02D31|nr:hypothetical protein [Novosphingobium sp. KN65.2]CDO34552.1 hypothetical protein SPHV1_1670002 [Novosphingobium sp. KN65.2]